MKNVIFSAVTVLGMAISGEAPACSSGAIADFLCKTGVINQDTANGLDAAHAAAGRPIETQILPAAADYFVPGSGDALRLYDQVNRNGGLGSIGGLSQIPGGPALIPNGQFPVPNGQFPIQAGQPIQPPMGVFCGTQAGRFGPGMPAPLGSFCTASTPWGPMQGQIIM